MITGHRPSTLKAFAERVADAFNAGKIRAPIHLDGGNEDQLIEVFQDVKEDDWVLGTWRMMSKCLLKGVPEEELFQAVLSGRSITLAFPGYRILSSAIVGGILPIALGLAWGIKRAGGSERVFCFLGDMARETGVFTECVTYGANFALPITWIIEDNGKSVCTPTVDTWGLDRTWGSRIEEYQYELNWPHSGAGKRVNF